VLFDLGRRIAELREGGGRTQQILADSVGVSPQRLREIESGAHNPSVRSLVRLADALGVPLAALFELPASRERRGPGRPRKAPLAAAEAPAPTTPSTNAARRARRAH